VSRLRHDERGFTLPELVISMAILGIVMTMFSQMLTSSSNTGQTLETAASLQSETRAAISTLTRDFRAATTAGPVNPVESISPTAFTFDAPDRATPFHMRRISYRYVNGEIDRSEIDSTNTNTYPWTYPASPTVVWIKQAEDVTNPSPFVFYDDTGAITTDPNAVRSMRINLTVQNAKNNTSTYTALITIRSAEQ
jgi:prepilin-type N-terminal cleavage/methylation domain-containing protein